MHREVLEVFLEPDTLHTPRRYPLPSNQHPACATTPTNTVYSIEAVQCTCLLAASPHVGGTKVYPWPDTHD